MVALAVGACASSEKKPVSDTPQQRSSAAAPSGAAAPAGGLPTQTLTLEAFPGRPTLEVPAQSPLGRMGMGVGETYKGEGITVALGADAVMQCTLVVERQDLAHYLAAMFVGTRKQVPLEEPSLSMPLLATDSPTPWLVLRLDGTARGAPAGFSVAASQVRDHSVVCALINPGHQEAFAQVLTAVSQSLLRTLPDDGVIRTFYTVTRDGKLLGINERTVLVGNDAVVVTELQGLILSKEDHILPEDWGDIEVSTLDGRLQSRIWLRMRGNKPVLQIQAEAQPDEGIVVTGMNHGQPVNQTLPAGPFMSDLATQKLLAAAVSSADTRPVKSQTLVQTEDGVHRKERVWHFKAKDPRGVLFSEVSGDDPPDTTVTSLYDANGLVVEMNMGAAGHTLAVSRYFPAPHP